MLKNLMRLSVISFYNSIQINIIVEKKYYICYNLQHGDA